MIDLVTARREVLESMAQLSHETVELADAGGRVLAGDVIANEDIPAFDNSGMDGYAVMGSDVAKPGAMLRITGEIAAGMPGEGRVSPGTAMKIMTGAPLPDGADTVVRIEDTRTLDTVVHIDPAVEVGTAVRPAGADIASGSVVFPRGTRLAPAHLAVLAAVGESRPIVHRRPRVALFSTGDELTPPSTAALRRGQIRDSNRVLLAALLSEVAALRDMGIARDDPAELHSSLGRAAAGADAIVTSGGVSLGNHDHVRAVLGDLGSIELWRVAIKPAKPFAFGHIAGAAFFGLPGNPVSAAVAFEQLVRPALLAMQGARLLLRPRVRAVAGERLLSEPGRLEFVRVTLGRDGRGRMVARRSGGQASNVLSALAAADGLALIPKGVGELRAGSSVEVELLHAMENRGAEDE